MKFYFYLVFIEEFEFFSSEVVYSVSGLNLG